MTKELLRQALDALKENRLHTPTVKLCLITDAAIEALEAAIAQPKEGDANDAERLTVLQLRLHQMQFVQDRLLKALTSIHALLHPPMFAHEGKTYKFVNPDANETLDELSKRIKAIPDEIDAAIANKKAKS